MNHMGSYSYYLQECQGGRPVSVFLDNERVTVMDRRWAYALSAASFLVGMSLNNLADLPSVICSGERACIC